MIQRFDQNPSVSAGVAASSNYTHQILNTVLIEKILLDPSAATNKNYRITNGVPLSWIQLQSQSQSSSQFKLQYTVVAVYPDILFEGPRQYLKQWADRLLQQAVREYDLFYGAAAAAVPKASSTTTPNSSVTATTVVVRRPDPALFDATFRVLLANSKTQKQQQQPANAKQQQQQTAATTTPQPSAAENSSSNSNNAKMRHWHDGNATVTAQAMAALDKSSDNNTHDDGDDTAAAAAKEEGHERALREARAAYLPTDPERMAAELEEANAATASVVPPQSWMTGLFQQLTGNKVLTAADLEKPVARMEELLQQKNVAQDISREICAAVLQQLVGKKLNSLYSVQTAVQQALETALTKILNHNRGGDGKSVDLLRAVMQKRGDGSLLSSFRGGGATKNRRPYVITVMGINGIGKTTTLAKLAYYFTQHGCKPLLVAGDTFRSGAIEQLQVHADCLGIPLFQQGYSKDPSAVAAAAIAQGAVNGNDVVLIDTAGRMQNNVPLMKALGKLVTDNKPDCCLMVCEALVGHDGVSQYNMFRQATLGRVDGLILTKFDTVDTKIGACLTLTHECGAPIVFLGVGQKYHHLKKLHVSTVIKSLFS